MPRSSKAKARELASNQGILQSSHFAFIPLSPGVINVVSFRAWVGNWIAEGALPYLHMGVSLFLFHSILGQRVQILDRKSLPNSNAPMLVSAQGWQTGAGHIHRARPALPTAGWGWLCCHSLSQKTRSFLGQRCWTPLWAASVLVILAVLLDYK